MFRWDTLRALYFSGGDGERRMRLDVHSVGGVVRTPRQGPGRSADAPNYHVRIACLAPCTCARPLRSTHASSKLLETENMRLASCHTLNHFCCCATWIWEGDRSYPSHHVAALLLISVYHMWTCCC